MLGGLAVAIGDSVAAGTREAALVALVNHPGQSVAQLSRALGRSHSATVRLVDGLKRDELIERHPGGDARSVAVALTSAGAAAAGAVRLSRAAALDALVTALSGPEVAQLQAAAGASAGGQRG